VIISYGNIFIKTRPQQLLKSSDNGTKGTTLPENAETLYDEITEVVLKDHPELEHLDKSYKTWYNNIIKKKRKILDNL